MNWNKMSPFLSPSLSGHVIGDAAAEIMTEMLPRLRSLKYAFTIQHNISSSSVS